MKLLRHGDRGNERPGILDQDGHIRDLSSLVEDINGDMFLKIVEAGDGNRHDHFLKMGEVANIHNILFAFNAYTDGAVNITLDEENNYSIESPF